MPPDLVLDCSVGEGGGGAIRAALPLSIITGRPVRLINVRAKRSPETRGIGWTHSCFIDAICRWTGSHAEYAWGSTAVRFTPGSAARGPLYIDLDDPDRTFATDAVKVTRDYSDASDSIAENIDNRDGRGIRGHAMSVFFLGLLPLLCTAADESSVEITGGTETLAAPFVDVVRDVLFPAAAALTGRSIRLSIGQRGCMGRGGGQGRATVSAASDRPDRLAERWSALLTGARPDVAERSVDARVYLFGRQEWCTANAERARWVLAKLADRLQLEIDSCLTVVPYAVNRLQSLFLMPCDVPVRDVSFGAEESNAGALHVTSLLHRLASEVQHGALLSRFLVEQLLPLACLTPGRHVFATERATPHLRTVAALARTLTQRDIRIDACAARCQVTVT